MKRHPVLLILIGIFLILIISLPNLKLRKDNKEAKNKVILIGLDGATWKVIRPLIREGKLPHIAGLINNGSSGILLSEEPLLSIAIWTTIATGKSRREHGIMHFAKKEKDSFNYSSLTSSDRKVKALWNILSDYGLSVGIVNWWATWPAEKVNGYIVSDYFQFLSSFLKNPLIVEKRVNADIMDTTYPKNIFEIIKSYQEIKTPPEEFSYLGHKEASLREATSFVRQAREEEIDESDLEKMLLINRIKSFSSADMRTFLVGRCLLRRFPVDLFAIYLPGIDSIQHPCWGFYEPNAPGHNFHFTKEEIDLFGQIIPKYYEWCDDMIGQLLNESDKRDCTVIIVSDHGFRAFYEPFPYYFNLVSLFEKLGWLRLKNEKVSWSESKVYPPLILKSQAPYRPVCINLQGRESFGVVKAKDYDPLRIKIKEELLALETQEGKKLFEDVIMVKNPKKENVDLKVRMNSLLSPEDRIIINGETFPLKKFMIPFFWTGDHEPEGIIIMSGRRIKAGQIIEGATIYDVTPTILALLGVPVGKDMEGKVLVDVIEKEHWIKSPLRYIDSHDTGLSQRRGPLQEHFFNEKMKERLRSVGYLQ